MPYTVAYRDAGIKRHEFEAYVRLLEKRGIDWSNTPRVEEPGTDNRWLRVWADPREADEFCKDLQAETHDEKWYVRELANGTQPSLGALARVVILMRSHSLGADFSLHPHSRVLIRRRFPKARPVSSISIEWSTKDDFEQQHGPIWDHVAAVLTGLTLEQLGTLEGYQVFDLMRERTIYDGGATQPV
jgi:hypothetical protein